MSQGLKLFIGGCVGALVLLLLGIALWSDAQNVGKAVTSVTQAKDLPFGTQVAIYGGVQKSKGNDPLALFVFQQYECTYTVKELPDKVIKNEKGTPVATQDGGTTVEETCSWNEKWRRTDPFTLIVKDGWNADAPVPVVNSGYMLDGPQRTIGNSYNSNLRVVGFDVGDGVLVIGSTTPMGIQARTVFGGTLDTYIGRQTVLGWISMLGALACAAFAGWVGYHEFR